MEYSALGLMLFLPVLALFVVPGVWWVSWLHDRDRFSWPFRTTLGSVWSFALFSLIGGPFLWFGGSFRIFSFALAAFWVGFVSISLWLWLQLRRRTPTHPEEDAETENDVLHCRRYPARDGKVRSESLPIPRLAWAALASYLFIAGTFVCLWARGDMTMQMHMLALSPFALVLGTSTLIPFRTKLAALLTFTHEDDETPPRAWSVLAAAFVLLQAIGTAVYFRPDWDDAYYLGAVLDYEYSPSLNDRDPSTRAMIGVDAAHRAMCLELWGAVICRLTGSDPQTLFHSLLPPLFVLAAYSAYAALFRQILPRKWIPLAVVGLSGYFLWGIGGQFGAANHFLIRIWQGKAVLLHLALPLIAALLIQFARKPEIRHWYSLVATVCCGLGFSSSAIFLGVALILCLSLALAFSLLRRRMKFLGLAAAACLPLLAEAVAILADARSKTSTSALPPSVRPEAQWASQLLANSAHGGCTELIWWLSLPLTAILLPDRQRWAFPVFYPLILLGTFANPFLLYRVAAYVTSPDAYYRLFWLFPVGVGLGTALTLLGRSCVLFTGSSKTIIRDLLPLSVVLAGIVVLAVLPGVFVWSPENRMDAYMFPQLAKNLQKVPPDLIEIAGRLNTDSEIEQGLILCGEEVASFLTPCSAHYRYVVVRPLYLPTRGDGAKQETSQRYFLMLAAQAGDFAEALRVFRMRFGAAPVPPDTLIEIQRMIKLRSRSDVPGLMKKYRVRYVITSAPYWLDAPPTNDTVEHILRQRDELLQHLGFHQTYAGGEYSLWVCNAGGSHH